MINMMDSECLLGPCHSFAFSGPTFWNVLPLSFPTKGCYMFSCLYLILCVISFPLCTFSTSSHFSMFLAVLTMHVCIPLLLLTTFQVQQVCLVIKWINIKLIFHQGCFPDHHMISLLSFPLKNFNGQKGKETLFFMRNATWLSTWQKAFSTLTPGASKGKKVGVLLYAYCELRLQWEELLFKALFWWRVA